MATGHDSGTNPETLIGYHASVKGPFLLSRGGPLRIGPSAGVAMVAGRSRDPSKLSTNPKQIRTRMRRRGVKMDEDIRLYMEHAYHKPIEEWDLEELARGRVRDKNGEFRGRAPSWVTPEIMKEAKRRLLLETYGKLAGHIDQAVLTMGNLLVSEDTDDNGKPLVDARTKFAAAAFIIEHTIGKPKAVIEHTADENVRGAIAAAIILDDGMPQDEPLVIEGEVVEEEEFDDADSE